MAESETRIINQAFSKIGSLRINDFSDLTESSPQAIQARTQYEPTRDALIRSYNWRFARERVVLSQDTETPALEWDFQYILPSDFMALVSIYEGRFTDVNFRNYAIEGERLLTNETTMCIRYTKKVTDVSKFDPLFVQLLVWTLADTFIGPLAGGDSRIQLKIDRTLAELTLSVRAFDGQETNTAGRFESGTWNDSKFQGRDPARLG